MTQTKVPFEDGIGAGRERSNAELFGLYMF